MDERLNIRIPIKVDGGTSLSKLAGTLIKKNESRFYPLFARLIESGNAGVTVVDDSLEVADVAVDADAKGGVASITFLSDFYAGCKDINSTDEHEVDLEFEIVDSFMVIDMVLPPRWVIED